MSDTQDLVQSFQLDASGLRGRMVRFGPALHEILERHAYPPAVNYLLAETVVLAALLAASLKYDGIFTLQTKGDGPIRQLVADITSGGDVRACASFQAEKVRGPTLLGSLQLLGKGYLAFTVDQGADTDRYQGIVELAGSNMLDCARHYFQQSEQIATALMMHVGEDEEGRWRGAAIMLQQMPLVEVERNLQISARDEDWRRATALMQTCTKEEMLSPDLAPADLLWRLFHDEGLRVYDPRPLRHACRCSRDRVERVLRSLPQSEIMSLQVDGKVSVDCEFCGQDYAFSQSDLDALYSESAGEKADG